MELDEQRRRYIRNKMGRCGKCKYSNFNHYNGDTYRSRNLDTYCLVRRYDTFIVGWIGKLLCRYFDEYNQVNK